MDRPAPNVKPRKHLSLETEVIVAVIGLYLFIAGMLLLVHHLQPEGQETKTSSPSPSHADRYGVPGGAPHTVRPDRPPAEP
jgi:hypothetical protein